MCRQSPRYCAHTFGDQFAARETAVGAPLHVDQLAAEQFRAACDAQYRIDVGAI